MLPLYLTLQKDSYIKTKENTVTSILLCLLSVYYCQCGAKALGHLH